MCRQVCKISFISTFFSFSACIRRVTFFLFRVCLLFCHQRKQINFIWNTFNDDGDRNIFSFSSVFTRALSSFVVRSFLRCIFYPLSVSSLNVDSNFARYCHRLNSNRKHEMARREEKKHLIIDVLGIYKSITHGAAHIGRHGYTENYEESKR